MKKVNYCKNIVHGGTAYSSKAPEFTPGSNGGRVTRSLVLYAMFCRSLFVLFLVAIVLSVLRNTAPDYPFGIFKLFLTNGIVSLCLM